MRILWIKTELLHPVDKGGKIRTFAMLRELRKRHHVTYLTLDDGSAPADAEERAVAEYCHEVVRVPFHPPRKGSVGFFAALALNTLSKLPYAVERYRSDALQQAIRGAVASRAIDLVICDFLAPSVNVPDDLGVPCVLFQHNVEASIWERHARVARNPIVRAYFTSQWRRMRAWERDECLRFDAVIAVSEADAAAYAAEYGVVHTAAVPTGVDVDFFRPGGTVDRRLREILFVGSMDWMPNEDGIAWFAEEVLPQIRRGVPDVALTIVGRSPSARVRALTGQPGVTVTGTVPDVRPYLERCAVLVVPLRIGGGTRIKIYEGMAMERATVSTTIGAEGLPVIHGEDLVLADDPAAFAAAVIDLLQHPERATAMGRHAAERVRREFSWARATDVFEQICEQAVHRASGGAPRSSLLPH